MGKKFLGVSALILLLQLSMVNAQEDGLIESTTPVDTCLDGSCSEGSASDGAITIEDDSSEKSAVPQIEDSSGMEE